MSLKNVGIALLVAAGFACCLLTGIVAGALALDTSKARIQSPLVVESKPEVVVGKSYLVTQESPAEPAQVACDPSTVAYPSTDRELNPNIVESVTGPAILEYWDQYAPGDVEAVWKVDAGVTLRLKKGLRGHLFPQNSQADLDCVFPTHVQIYSMKPQHQGLTYDQLVIMPPLAN